MAKVTFNGNTFNCATAIKGADYVHLLDASGLMIAAFDGVTDFSGFSISDGEWLIPTPEHECYVAVIKDDGTVGKGGHRCNEILSKTLPEDCFGDELPTDDYTPGRIFFLKVSTT